MSPLDWPWKTTPKWLFDCPNPSSGSKDTVIMILKSADLYSCTADLTSPLDWPWKTTPIWPLICVIPWCRSQFTAILPLCQLICTAAQLICTVEQLIWPHHLICHKKITLIDASHAVSKLILAHKIYQTIPNHTKPNLMTWNFEEASQIKFQVTFDSSYMLICGPKYHFLFKFGPKIWKMSKKYMF